MLIVARKAGITVKIFRISLFGHREVDDLLFLHRRLESVVREILAEKEYVAFFIGRNGEFDEYAASVIKGIQREIGTARCEINLVLPYSVANLEYYEDYYNDVIIPETVQGVHPKSAIKKRNEWMIEHSDLCIFFLEHPSGGAHIAFRHAKRMNKSTINLFEAK